MVEAPTACRSQLCLRRRGQIYEYPYEDFFINKCSGAKTCSENLLLDSRGGRLLNKRMLLSSCEGSEGLE